jgi:hypothetical protein
MILNKFRQIRSRVSFAKVQTFSWLILVLSLFCCKKTVNINANKAFVNVIHTAYNAPAVLISFGGVSLFSTPLAFGQSTGTDANPYDTTTAGVQELQLFLGSSPTPSLAGNTALQQQAYYSLFVYDTLNQNSIKIIVFQNSVGSRTDTFTYIRYLNFSPGSTIGIKVVYPRDTTGLIKASAQDTVNIPASAFVGYNPNPAAYGFSTVHIGYNNIYAYIDSANPRLDSLNPAFDSANFRYLGPLNFDSTINYNVFLQGFLDSTSGGNLFQMIQLKSFTIN